MSNSNRSGGSSKTAASTDKPARKYFVPPKPKGSPLTPHAGGKWMKKINGRLYYFGRWGTKVGKGMVRLPGDGHKEALATYKAELNAGEFGANKPVQPAEAGLTIRKLCDDFLIYKQSRLDSGEIAERTFSDYRGTTDRIFKFFGRDKLVDQLTPADFERLRASFAKMWGPVRLGNEVMRVRSAFRHSRKSDLVPKEFTRPSAAVMRKHRATSAKKFFKASEIQVLLDSRPLKDDKPMRAMILLAINCGFGNGDMSALTKDAVDLDSGWVDFPRPKTGVARRCPLWPETVAALRAALIERPAAKAKADRNCFFITEYGHRYVRVKATEAKSEKNENRTKYIAIDGIGMKFGTLLRRLKINGRKGLGFYSLRHTFATVALQTQDRDCVKALMGHVEGDILSGYDETGPSDERRQKVVQHVHGWLFGTEGGAA